MTVALYIASGNCAESPLIDYILGIDHKRLMFRRNRIDRRLTAVHGHLVEEVLA